MFLFCPLKPVTAPFRRTFDGRAAMSVASSPPAIALKFVEPKVLQATTPNGIRVLATSMKSPLAMISVHYDAGSRYESHEQLGATHFLRRLCAATGSSSTAFAKTRHLQQCGAQLSCSSDRQRITYTMICPRHKFRTLQGYLVDAAMRCHYHPWEVDDHRTEVECDLDRITPQELLMDKIQKAAFKGPLRNSVFCQRHAIDEIDSEMLRTFTNDNFKTKRCSVTSSGLPHEDTFCVASNLQLPSGISESTPTKCDSGYRAGYEYYDLGANSETLVAVAVPGVGSSCGEFGTVLAFCTVAAACGTRNWADCSHRFCRIPQSPLATLHNDEATQLRAFNISYSDAGIFGIAMRTPACLASEVATKAVQFLRRELPALTPEQFEIGKSRLIMDVASCDESGLCTVAGPSLGDTGDLLKEIRNLDMDYVKKIAQYISDNRFHVNYLDCKGYWRNLFPMFPRLCHHVY